MEKTHNTISVLATQSAPDQNSTTAYKFTSTVSEEGVQMEQKEFTVTISFVEGIIIASVFLCICVTMMGVISVICYAMQKRQNINDPHRSSESTDHVRARKMKRKDIQNVNSNSVAIKISQSHQNENQYRDNKEHTDGKIIREDNESSSSDSSLFCVMTSNKMRLSTMSSGNVEMIVTPLNFTQDNVCQNDKQGLLKIWINDVLKLPQYYQIFFDQGYDSCEMIKEIRFESELEEIGITNKKHQMIIMANIRRL